MITHSQQYVTLIFISYFQSQAGGNMIESLFSFFKVIQTTLNLKMLRSSVVWPFKYLFFSRITLMHYQAFGQ